MTFSGAWVSRHLLTTGVDYTTPAVLTWDTEYYDYGGWFSFNDPTKLIVPAGVERIKIRAQGYIGGGTTSTSVCSIEVYKNGSAMTDPKLIHKHYQFSSTMGAFELESPVLFVTPGDEFELYFASEAGDTTLNVESRYTWIAVESIDTEQPAYSRALVKNAADQTGVDHSTPVVLAWDTEVEDDDGWWDAGNPNVFTVPAGINFIRLKGQFPRAQLSNLSSYVMNLLINGALIRPGVSIRNAAAITGSESHIIQMNSPWIPVNAGDEISMKANTSGDTSSDIEADDSWFYIEGRDDEPVGGLDNFKRVLLVRDFDLALEDFTGNIPVEFNHIIYDVGRWALFDFTTNITNGFVVPPGVSRIKMRAGIGFDSQSSSDTFQIEIRKNGSSLTPSSVHRDSYGGGDDALHQVDYPIIDVTPGDEFEMYVDTTGDVSAIYTANGTWLYAEMVN